MMYVMQLSMNYVILIKNCGFLESYDYFKTYFWHQYLHILMSNWIYQMLAKEADCF